MPEGGAAMMRWAISVTISQREMNEDRDEVISSMLAGRLDLPEDVTLDQFAALPVEGRQQHALDYMGESWGSLWYYGPMEQGLDRDSRQLFGSRAEAEDIARQCRFFDDSFYEVWEVEA